MTTTTERPRVSSAGSGAAGHLRLYLMALLAAAYVLAWWLFGMRAPAKPEEARATEPIPETSPGQGMATWFHDLPVAERPVVDMPPGWHIAERTTSSPVVSARELPVPVRVSPARAGRIRTRSS